MGTEDTTPLSDSEYDSTKQFQSDYFKNATDADNHVCVEINGQRHWIHIENYDAFEKGFAQIFQSQSPTILFKLALKIAMLDKIVQIDNNFL